MTPRTDSLADRLRSGEQVLGALLPLSDPMLVEHAGHAGLDYVVIDTEHGPADQQALSTHLVTAAAVGLHALVRVGGPQDVLRVLDLGAAGIVAPHVSSVEDAEALVAAVRYPPLGARGFATYTRAGRYGRADAVEHVERARDHVVVIAMVEDPDGVAAAPAIARVDGITGLFLGPADLACALGVPGRWDAPRVAAARIRVRDAAHDAGGCVMSICSDPSTATAHFEAGSDAVVYNVQGALSAMFTDLARASPVAGPGGARRAGGEQLVLLPGMLGDAGTWEQVAERMDDRVGSRVARIDLDASIEEMASSVLAQAPQRFALAGHSLGAIVALEVVRQAPHRVSRLALLNASARAGSPEQLEAWAALRARLATEAFSSLAADLATSNLPEHRRADADLVERGVAMARSIGSEGLERQLAAQVTRPDSRASLAEMSLPAGVVSGERDEVCPVSLQQELAEGLPRAEHVVLGDVGHMSPMEAPAEVAEVLDAWLQAG